VKANLNKLAGAVVLALVASGAQAQSVPDALRAVARKAVETNPEVQARWQAFLASDAERDAIRGGYRPRVDVQAAVGVQNIGASPTSPLGTYHTDTASITLRQMLYDGGFTAAEAKRASFAKLTRYYELLDIAEDMTLEATRAYADVLRYRELVALAKDNYVLHKQTSQQIEERAKAGVGRQADVEQATGRVALAESNLLTEVSNLHDVTARYLRIVGEAPPAKMQGIPESFKLAGMPSNLQQALENAYLNNPAMNAAVESVDALREQVESRKAAHRPTVDFRLSHRVDHNLNGYEGRYNDTTAQVVLNMNLYNGGSDDARLRQAAYLVNQGLDQQEKTCRDIRQAVMISYNDSVKLTEKLGYLDQHRLTTEKAREAYRQQFDLGQRTLLDLLNSQNEFFEASRAYANARYDLVVAKSRTMAGVGGLRQAMAVERQGLPTAQDLGQERVRNLNGICTVDPAAVKATVDKDKLMADAPPLRRVVAPVVPAPIQPMPKKVTFSADAFFDFDKSSLKPDAQAELADFAQKVKNAGQTKELLVAVGHTDSVGTDAYNMGLSLARAKSVKAYLVEVGLNGALIKTEGRGESEPVADNATAEGRAKNRRVDIIFAK
jgi:adhesin transport system outer membrane protein